MVQQLHIQSLKFAHPLELFIHPAHMYVLKLLLLMESITNSNIAHRQKHIIHTLLTLAPWLLAMIQFSIVQLWNSTTTSLTIIALLLHTHRLHLLHQPLLTMMKWSIVVQPKLVTEWRVMYALLLTVPFNIASLVILITIVQHSYVQLHMQHSNIVTPPISCTIHILITAILFHLHLQFPLHTIMLSIALLPNHTTIKWVLFVPPQAHPLIIMLTLITQAVTITIL
jgi:hypothetical protein